MVGDYQRLVAHLDMEHGFTQRKLSENLLEFQSQNSQFKNVGVSAPSISRNLKSPHPLREKTVEFYFFEAFLKTRGILTEGKTLSMLLNQIREDAACNERAESMMRKKKSNISFETLKHLMGVWQTITYSTYVSQSSGRTEIPPDQVRFGLRLITPHKEARPNRLRLRVCDIGPETTWDGSADVNATSVYMRIREVSSGQHSGERIFSIFQNPNPQDARANKSVGKYIAYGCTVAVVRQSTVASQHIAFDVAALRYLPTLTKIYYPDIPDSYTDDSKVNAFLQDQEKLASDYCLRKPERDILGMTGALEYGKEAYIDVASIIQSITREDIVKKIGPNILVFTNTI